MDTHENVRFQIAEIRKSVAAIRLAEKVRQNPGSEKGGLRWRVGHSLIVLGQVIAGPAPRTHSHAMR